MNPLPPSKKLGCSGASSKADLIDVNRNSLQVSSLNHYGLVLMLVIVLLLLVDFRNIRKMILVIILLVIAVVWMRMGLTGLQMTMLNIMAIPMIIGIGIDLGGQVIHRYQIEDNTAHNAVFSSTGRAVLLTSLTTMLCFGSLWFAVYRGLGSMGIAFYWRWPLFFRHCFCNLETHSLGGATRS